MLVTDRKQALERVIEDLLDREFSAHLALNSNITPDRAERLQRAVDEAVAMLDIARERLADMGDEHDND